MVHGFKSAHSLTSRPGGFAFPHTSRSMVSRKGTLVRTHPSKSRGDRDTFTNVSAKGLVTSIPEGVGGSAYLNGSKKLPGKWFVWYTISDGVHGDSHMGACVPFQKYGRPVFECFVCHPTGSICYRVFIVNFKNKLNDCGATCVLYAAIYATCVPPLNSYVYGVS